MGYSFIYIGDSQLKEFKLIVAGGRTFNNYDDIAKGVLDYAEKISDEYGITIVSGMAGGADRLAYEFAKANSVKVIPMYAQWNILGKRAGFVRNEAMADISQGLLAFWNGYSKGTKHMIDTMINMGKPVMVFEYKDIPNPKFNPFQLINEPGVFPHNSICTGVIKTFNWEN